MIKFLISMVIYYTISTIVFAIISSKEKWHIKINKKGSLFRYIIVSFILAISLKLSGLE